MLDSRLSFAYELYDPCELAADIGTDHAYLPAALLSRGKCERMILTDISESALNNARKEITRKHLNDRVTLYTGDGLKPIVENCNMISVMGMGGKSIASILLEGESHLYGASLLLSAHTDLDHVRSAVSKIGYRIISEDPCFDSGRFYLFIKAKPGKEELTEKQIRTGVRLTESNSPFLKGYILRRKEVLEYKLKGLKSADSIDHEVLDRTEQDIMYYNSVLGGEI